MMTSALIRSIFILGLGAIMGACATVAGPIPADINTLKNPDQLASASTKKYYEALHSDSRQQAIALSQASYAYADRCLKINSKMPACLYYRALATGLYYQHHVLGFPKGLRSMRLDLVRAAELEPTYANAGAYRVLGVLYMRAPTFGNEKKNVVQDLPGAKLYLQQAVKLAPDYALNYLFLSKVLIELEEISAAKEMFKLYSLKAIHQDVQHDYPQAFSDAQKIKAKLKNK